MHASCRVVWKKDIEGFAVSHVPWKTEESSFDDNKPAAHGFARLNADLRNKSFNSSAFSYCDCR